MKIAMIGLKGVPFPAGIENFTEEVGWRLVERGHEVTVYVRPYVEVGETYRGMRIRRVPSINTKHLDALTHTFLATVDVMFSDAEVVHYHALGPSVFSIGPRLSGQKVVAQVHGLDWQRKKWGPFARLCLRFGEWAAMRFPHRSMTISQDLQHYFQTRYGRPVDYVPTGVESYQRRPPADIQRLGLGCENYILFLGRLVPEKGCHFLIEAYERMNTGMKLVIAGPESHSREYAESLRRPDNPNIIFTGAVKGTLLEELYSNAYVYVLPSEVEGLPHSLMQALAFGRCVLASDIGANREALGDCGLTFGCADVADLQAKLEHLIAHPELVREYGRDGPERMRRLYSWDVVVDRLESIYRELEGRSAQVEVS